MYNKQIMSLLVVSLVCVVPMQAMLGRATRLSTIKNVRTVHQNSKLSTAKVIIDAVDNVINGAIVGGLGLGSITFFGMQAMNSNLRSKDDKNSSLVIPNSSIELSVKAALSGGALGGGLVASYKFAGPKGCKAFALAAATLVVAIKAKD